MSQTDRRPLTRQQPTPAARLARRLGRGARRLTPGLAPRPLWLRIVMFLTGLLYFCGTWLVLGILSVPSQAGGWWPTALAFLPALLTLVVGTGIGRRWWASLAAVPVLALALGVWAYDTSPPEPERLAALARDVGVPDGWRTVSAETGGSTWGLFGDWPRFDGVYATDESPRRAAAALAAHLEAAGWDHETPTGQWMRAHPVTYQEWSNGRWQLSVSISGPRAEGRQYDTSVPADATEVSLGYR
ncbi:MAG: hypothetical protein ACXVEU_07350 [Nocardioidaceae bacterium]